MRQLEIVFAGPLDKSKARRYRLIRHHGSAWVSLPRPWLQDRGVRNGDRIILFCYVGAPQTMLIRHEKKPAVGTTT